MKSDQSSSAAITLTVLTILDGKCTVSLANTFWDTRNALQWYVPLPGRFCTRSLHCRLKQVVTFQGRATKLLSSVHFNTLSTWSWSKMCEHWSKMCEQVLFVHVFTIIPPRLTDPCNFITVLLVSQEPEQMTLLFRSAACRVTPHGLHTANRR